MRRADEPYQGEPPCQFERFFGECLFCGAGFGDECWGVLPDDLQDAEVE